ncbi:IS110 family transposase [Arthrobacter rhombi]|uniref:IS110 family transposase n=1 Tax=Arthrobacter rhombi TaxID=71253 RepID=UPI003FD54288
MSFHHATQAVVVAVDVGKNTLALSATDSEHQVLLDPFDAAMTRTGLTDALEKIQLVLPPDTPVRVGIEAAGHYHRPLMSPVSWPPGWELLQLNPAHVAEQRRIQGRRRVKTDAIDLEAITEPVLAGRGQPMTERSVVIGTLTALAAHRYRRIEARTALKNQILGELDRTFPGLSLALPNVLATKVGRLVAEHFADPDLLSSLGVEEFIRFAKIRGLKVRGPMAARQVAAARDALPLADAAPARDALAEDLALLRLLDGQICTVDAQLAALLPATPFLPLLSVPGWSASRAAAYGAGVGEPSRWPGPSQIYRASGLSPSQYELAGRRRDGSISREGSVELRRALIGLGNGLWLHAPAAKAYGASMRKRGKKGKVIACAMANRANRIAYALVRDQCSYNPTRWTIPED